MQQLVHRAERLGSLTQAGALRPCAETALQWKTHQVQGCSAFWHLGHSGRRVVLGQTLNTL